MRFFDQALVPPMAEVMRSQGPALSKRAFHLAGGTAVALYLGHRRSVDLDWISTASPANRSKILELYQKKLETSEIAHLLYVLAYFEDAEREPMPEMLWSEDRARIKTTIEAWVRESGSPD